MSEKRQSFSHLTVCPLIFLTVFAKLVNYKQIPTKFLERRPSVQQQSKQQSESENLFLKTPICNM